MTTEVTASLMIGPMVPDSAHGKPAPFPTGKWFCPSHLTVLMEGARATWIVQGCEWLGGSPSAFRILPRSPEYLLAAAVLGYTALTAPDALHRVDTLRNAIEPSAGGTLRVGPIDRVLAAEVFSTCAELVDGVVTVLPGSSITDDELWIAAGCGMRVAVATSTVGASPVAVAQ